MTIQCCICRKGPREGVSVYRINAKSVTGLWACGNHVAQIDGTPDAELHALVNTISQEPDDDRK